MENVIELKQRQNRDLKNDTPNVLEAMFEGVERSKWGSLANMAAEVADRAPLEFLKMLSRCCIEPPNKD